MRGLDGMAKNEVMGDASVLYWERIFVGAHIYMAAARDSMFVFAPEDSLYGVSVTPGTFERLKRGEAVEGYFAIVFCCHCRWPLPGNCYYVVILHRSQKSRIASRVAALLLRTFGDDGCSPVLGRNIHCVRVLGGIIYGAMTSKTREGIWHVWCEHVTFGKLPCLGSLAGCLDDDAELADETEAPTATVTAADAAAARAAGMSNPVVDSDDDDEQPAAAQGSALPGGQSATSVAPVIDDEPPAAPVETPRRASVEPQADVARLFADPKAETKCDAKMAAAHVPTPVSGKLVGKSHKLELLCKHQWAFHEKYGDDASPEAFHHVEWDTVTRGQSPSFMVPDKIVYEDECDLNSPELHAEFDAREKLRQTGFEVEVVKLAVPMSAEPLVPLAHTTTFGKTQDALVTKLRKDILDKADERFRALRTRTLSLT